MLVGETRGHIELSLCKKVSKESYRRLGISGCHRHANESSWFNRDFSFKDHNSLLLLQVKFAKFPTPFFYSKTVSAYANTALFERNFSFSCAIVTDATVRFKTDVWDIADGANWYWWRAEAVFVVRTVYTKFRRVPCALEDTSFLNSWSFLAVQGNLVNLGRRDFEAVFSKHFWQKNITPCFGKKIEFWHGFKRFHSLFVLRLAFKAVRIGTITNFRRSWK